MSDESKLGPVQKDVLRCLRENGPFPGSGWFWDTTSGTIRICESLVKRGFVTRTDITIKGRVFSTYTAKVRQ